MNVDDDEAANKDDTVELLPFMWPELEKLVVISIDAFSYPFSH